MATSATTSLMVTYPNLKKIDLSNWNTTNLSNISKVFFPMVEEIIIDGWTFPASIQELFYNNIELTTISMNNVDSSKVTNMTSLFDGCENLTTINLSNLDLHNCKYLSQMFYDCTSLVEVNLSGWDMSSLIYDNFMFYNCSQLTTINISGWIYPSTLPTSHGNFFYKCSSLNKLILGEVSQTVYNWWVNRIKTNNLTNQVTIEYTIV